MTNRHALALCALAGFAIGLSPLTATIVAQVAKWAIIGLAAFGLPLGLLAIAIILRGHDHDHSQG